jgi:hypothetical protein
MPYFDNKLLIEKKNPMKRWGDELHIWSYLALAQLRNQGWSLTKYFNKPFHEFFVWELFDGHR